MSVNSTGEPFSLMSYPKPSENLQSISSLSIPSSALKTLTALAALRAVTPYCDTPSCLQSVGAPHSNESTAHRAHRHVCVRHAPSGSSGHCLPMMDAPLLDLADSPSCQQLCKARAERGVGLHSLDIPLCGAVFISARIPGVTGIRQPNYSGCKSVTCSFSVRIPQRPDIPLTVTQTAALTSSEQAKGQNQMGGGGELLSCLFNIYISCLSHLVYEFCITSCQVKASVYVNINSVCICSDVRV